MKFLHPPRSNYLGDLGGQVRPARPVASNPGPHHFDLLDLREGRADRSDELGPWFEANAAGDGGLETILFPFLTQALVDLRGNHDL